MTSPHNCRDSECRAGIVERLRSSEPLPACPFDKISPLYLTMPADKPCPFCGQENTLEGPDKCRGADTRIFGEAADAIAALQARVEELTKALEKARKFIDPDLDPPRMTNRELLVEINRALAMPLERSGGAT